MQQDFKKEYIEQQKKQEAMRRKRLARIGIELDDDTDTQGSTNGSVSDSRPQGSIPKSAPKRETARPNAQQRPRQVQERGTSPQRVTPRPVGMQRPTSYSQNGNNTAVGANNMTRNITAQERQNTAVRDQREGAVAKRQTSPMPASRTPQPKTGGSYRGKRPTVSDFDLNESEIFKKSLSEDESRAMMFALTGKAQDADDGGDVDIIDMGMIRKNKRQSVRTAAPKGRKNKAGCYIGRAFIALGTALAMVIVTVYAALLVIAYGPSETVRDLAVNSAMQASATKWAPYLVLPSSKVEEILNKSEEVVQDIVSIDDYDIEDPSQDTDIWENAKEGMLFDVVNGSTFKAYVLRVKDPSRVFVGTSTDDFSNSTAGVNVFQAADRYNALACINGGEFLDNGGHGSGYAPLGLTYSKGKCVFDDRSTRTFIGFTEDNRLIVRESMTQSEASSLGIRDAVSFQTGNTLIERDGDDIKFYYADGNTGTSQRTAIGQSADGTVIMIVTDGRTASSLGATHNDMIDMMVSYGAVSAGMLDGGSSAMMFYRDYYNKYDYDTSKLDQYQLQGLVNNYKAFTSPRRIPTFFMVTPEG